MNAATTVTGKNSTETGAMHPAHRIAFAEARSPLAFRGGLSNLSEYVGNDPTNATDPTGLTECDDRENFNTQKLVNCDQILEAHVNEAINSARTKFAKIPDGEAKGKAIAEEVYNQLGADSGFVGFLFSKSEAWLNAKDTLPTIERDAELPMVYRYTFKTSLYGGNPIGFKDGKVLAHKFELSANLSIAPTIRVGGVLMGTDKWGHFFQQGWWYYANNLNASERGQLGLYLEGDVRGFHGGVLPDTPEEGKLREQAMLDKLKILGGLPKPKFGSLGAETTGVISYADIAANEEGYKFYMDLAKNYKTFVFKATDYNLNEFNENNGATSAHPEKMRIKLVHGVTVNLDK